MGTSQGTSRTRDYYEDEGWSEVDGEVVEATLFGTREDGPLRRSAFNASMERIRAALTTGGTAGKLLECGCGGQPETGVLDLCEHYTGIDFSEPGLRLAETVLTEHKVDHTLVNGDICALPFDDHDYDTVYSAHVLYHIADIENQRAAFQEIVRVLRPGGVAVLVVANPRPLLFPGRLIKRVVADTPALAKVANRLRSSPPIPFKPLTMGTMRSFLQPHGTVDIVTAGIPTVMFNQRVSEYKGVGRRAWQAINWLETKHPRLSAPLGNNIQITFTKTASG